LSSKKYKNNRLVIYRVYRYTEIVSILYIVGTPIGNLGDITFRAVEILKSADVIACEDTRHTLELLTHFEIRKPLISCRAQNEESAARKITGLLKSGQTVAYASDAGTPGISDPGAVLVELVRKEGYPVVPVPGPSAFATLVSVAGAGGKTLIFEGFLSPSPGKRRRRLKELIETGYAFVLYESPFRIVKLLTDLADINGERRVVVGRELTKLHEEIVDGSAADIRDDFSARESIKGEFAVFVSGTKRIQLSDESTDN
jgi:16S rRNA (cytidine1402-2'-O)-methyltransferase